MTLRQRLIALINVISSTIKSVDNRITNLIQSVNNSLGSKADLVNGKLDPNQALVSNITYDPSIGLITFTDELGNITTIDLPIENLFQDAIYDSVNKKLVLETVTGGLLEISLLDLVNLNEIVISETSNPIGNPTSNEKIYFRSDAGTYWLNINSLWFGPLGKGLEDADREKLDSIEFGAQVNIVPSWDSIMNKPIAFPPSTHTHSKSDITDLTLDWGSLEGVPLEFPPTSHIHTVSEISDFPSAMNPTPHTHSMGDITGLTLDWNSISGKPSEFPPLNHLHTVSEISDFPTIPTSSSQIEEGSRLYFTTTRVLSTLLSGLSLVTGGSVVDTDSILIGIGKLQNQLNNIQVTYNTIISALGFTPENLVNKQDSLVVDGTGTKYVTVDAVNSQFNSLSTQSKVPKTIFVGGANASDATGLIERSDKPFSTLTKALEVRSAAAVASGSYEFDKSWKIIIQDSGSYTITKALTSSVSDSTNIRVSSLWIESSYSSTVTMTKNFIVSTVDLRGINLTLIPEAGVTWSQFNGGNLQLLTLTITGTSTMTGLTTGGIFQTYFIEHFIANNYSAIQAFGGSKCATPIILRKLTNNGTLFNASLESSRLNITTSDVVYIEEIVNSANVALSIQQTWTSGDRVSNLKLKKITNPGGNIVNYTYNTYASPNSMKMFLDLDNGNFENFYINSPYYDQPGRISGRCTVTYTVAPSKSFITIDRNNKTISSLGESFLLKDLRVKLVYPSTPSWQPIRISGAGTSTEQKQIILEDCYFETSHAIEIFSIISGVTATTESIIQFRGVNDFKNGKELILATSVTPTVSNFITSRGSNLRHDFGVVSANLNIQIFNEMSIGQMKPIRKITTSTYTLTNADAGCLFLVKANCTITVPSTLIAWFSAEFKTFSTFQLLFAAGSGTTLNSTDGLVLGGNRMCILFNENVLATFELEGELNP